ncbi:hypothetical protein HETIRDRAFT_315963 [Heterobasidion irregulare TC 32-1]|uniref:Uncharacterized protein n=1 Tax=Heterobasidion irregulare (strain TC 32-1) TaxID=747525 RepID=W4K9R0_HETIT|nr:uncharacterized protein HETIRDRAFT_315963 [Heterobasidion irregulare TC 32-1]ETW82582.1 hypothetical protein HETIRDRAFT_315963 [Heterobasidion irregulare TC 32-1]
MMRQIIFLVSWCSIDSKINNLNMYLNETLPGITVQVSALHLEQGVYPTAVIALAAPQKTTWDMSIGRDMSQIAPHTAMLFVTRDTCSGTSTL